jgi:perosamine synthetase
MQAYEQLEKEFCKFSGKKYAVAVNSGTSALHLALLAFGIGKGDEVIVPDFTFASCAFAVSYTGAKPVFVDCTDNLVMDIKKIQITKKIKAIMPVHVYGIKCPIPKIKGIKILEDLSEAPGIKPTGDIAIYSFQSSKVIHCEEGGMIVTDNKKYFEKIKHLKGIANDGNYYHDQIGFNYRMPNAQAKLALKSLKEYPKEIFRRYKAFNRLEKKYKTNLPVSIPWVYPVFKKPQEKSRCFFKPMSTLPMYNRKPGKNALKYSKIGYVINL